MLRGKNKRKDPEAVTIVMFKTAEGSWMANSWGEYNKVKFREKGNMSYRL